MKRIFILLLCLLSLGVHSQTSKQKYIEAAFIYKFIHYIKWKAPSSSKNITRIIVSQDESIYRELLKLSESNNKKDHINKIEVLKLSEVDDISKLEFHILFAKDLALIVDKKLIHQPLLITDKSDANLEEWNFIFKLNTANKVRFDVNSKKAAENDIFISSRLLKLGVKIIK